VTGNPELTGNGAGNRLSQHCPAGRAGAACSLREALQRTRDRQHSSRNLDASQDGVLGCDQEVAIQSQLEAAKP
jgi:hypothetical protein